MIFKDRKDAAEKLVETILQDKELVGLLKQKTNVFVVSLLRGGVVLGNIIAKKLKIEHLPLASVKIPAPNNPELAIGAVCFDAVYIEKDVTNLIKVNSKEISQQISKAHEKLNIYCKEFNLKKSLYERIKNGVVLIVDDGVATGSTVKAAAIFLKSQGPVLLILAVPVAPVDFDERGFAKVIIVHKDESLSSVSQFYEYFPQVENFEVKKLLN